MTGVIAVPDSLSIGQAIDELALMAECANAAELENRVILPPAPLTHCHT